MKLRDLKMYEEMGDDLFLQGGIYEEVLDIDSYKSEYMLTIFEEDGRYFEVEWESSLIAPQYDVYPDPDTEIREVFPRRFIKIAPKTVFESEDAFKKKSDIKIESFVELEKVKELIEEAESDPSTVRMI